MARAFTTNDDIQNSSVSGIDTRTITVLAWFKSTDAGTNTFYSDAVGTAGPDWRINLGMRGGGILFVNTKWTTTTGLWDTNTSTWDDGAWHCVVYQADSTLVSDNPLIFADGSSEAITETSTPVGSPPTGEDLYSIGELSGGQQDTNADLAHITFWDNDTVSSTIIAALSRGVNPFFVENSDIQLYLPFNGNNTAVSEWAQQAVGTNTGTTKATTSPPVELIENYL